MLSVVVSAALSAAVAFGVATYTVHRADDSQRREAVRAYLTSIYLPHSSAVEGVIACIAPRACSEKELLRTNRELNRTSLIVIALGSENISDASEALEHVLRVAVRARLGHEKQSDTILTRTAARATRLQGLIRDALLARRPSP